MSRWRAVDFIPTRSASEAKRNESLLALWRFGFVWDSSLNLDSINIPLAFGPAHETRTPKMPRTLAIWGEYIGGENRMMPAELNADAIEAISCAYTDVVR